MLWAGRIISWVLIVTGGLTWTIGQAGLDTTDKNLCEMAGKIWQAPIEGCHIVPALVTLWKLGFFAALVFLVIDGYHWLAKRQATGKRRSFTQHQDREIDHTAALFWIMERSAWGRWQKAQYVGWPWEIEKIQLRQASTAIWKASLNGDLVVRGRQKNSLEYTAIDSDFWRSASLDFEPNNAAIWKPVVHVPDEIKIPDYDNFILERAAVEALWPRHEWKYYWLTLILKIKAALKRKPRHMPEVEKKEDIIPVTIEPEVVAALPIETIPPPAPVSAPVAITPSPAAPEGWEKLFAVGDDGKSIWLRFLPDTKQYRGDALVLIVYGHKVLRDVTRITVPGAHAAVQKTIDNAPNQPKTTNGFLAAMIAMQRFQSEANIDWVDECVPRYLERVGLSQGGFDLSPNVHPATGRIL
jgi:hypothetical protein